MSALPKRESARRLLELVPEEHLDRVEKMLHDLVSEEDPVLAALAAAPEDDEGELTEEAIAGIEQARRSLAEGRSMSTEELCRRLGL